MRPESTVSVVVPVLNGADTIGDTLTALVNQAGAPPDTEIIVVDNGSTDGTPEVIRRFHVICLSERKRGPSAARNRGLYHAQGEVVAFLDADTVPTRRWLHELIAPFADAQVMLAAGPLQDYLPQTPAERFMSQLGVYQFEYSIFRAGLPHVCSCNMAVRRAAALAIQGWDESYLTAEDFDFTLRLVRHFGCPIVRAPGAVVMNRHRRTPEALRRQAWGYGEGMGKIHLGYPEIGRLNLTRRLRLLWTLSVRYARAALTRLAARLRWTTPERAEFFSYHWAWSWWFWRGYFSMLHSKEWRTP